MTTVQPRIVFTPHGVPKGTRDWWLIRDAPGEVFGPGCADVHDPLLRSFFPLRPGRRMGVSCRCSLSRGRSRIRRSRRRSKRCTGPGRPGGHWQWRSVTGWASGWPMRISRRRSGSGPAGLAPVAGRHRGQPREPAPQAGGHRLQHGQAVPGRRPRRHQRPGRRVGQRQHPGQRLPQHAGPGGEPGPPRPRRRRRDLPPAPVPARQPRPGRGPARRSSLGRQQQHHHDHRRPIPAPRPQIRRKQRMRPAAPAAPAPPRPELLRAGQHRHHPAARPAPPGQHRAAARRSQPPGSQPGLDTSRPTSYRHHRHRHGHGNAVQQPPHPEPARSHQNDTVNDGIPLPRGHPQRRVTPSGLATSTPQIFPVAYRRAVTIARRKFPPHRDRRDALRPAQIRQVRAGGVCEGRNNAGSRVLLSATLAGPAPSGGADTSRLCQGCSRPPRHHPGQAALSFTALLRQDGGEGLSPPLEQTAPHGAGRHTATRCTPRPRTRRHRGRRTAPARPAGAPDQQG